MKLRTANGDAISYEFPYAGTDKQIAPLLFISLIENAFKHGVSAGKESRIFFRLTVDEERLQFIAENPNNPKTESDESGSGIGITNLKKRLELIYPGKYELSSEVTDSIYRSELMIDLK